MKKKAVIIMEESSAAVMESHIPSVPSIRGSMITATIWKRSVLANEMAAETIPLFKAVKKEDPKMLNPIKRNEKEYSIKPLLVS